MSFIVNDMLINLNTKSYPVDPLQVVSRYPSILFPQDLSRVDWSDYGYAWVYYTKQPQYNAATHAVQEIAPTLNQDGKTYSQTWQVYPLTAEEAARKEQARLDKLATAARAQRDRLLYQSDWTQLPDIELSQEAQAQWKSYRHLLRSISEQTGFPENIAWPEPPQ